MKMQNTKEQFEKQVKALSSDQLKAQKQHMIEETAWANYQRSLLSRGVEYLDTSLKYEKYMAKEQIKQFEKEIEEETAPEVVEMARSKLWFAKLDLETGLELKAIRKRKQLMAQHQQFTTGVTQLNEQSKIIVDRLDELTKKVEEK